MVKRVCRDCPIPHCGAKYLVKLSNHLTDVHRLDYIQRRKWLQEAKLQPKIRVVIYPAKASQEFRMHSKSKTTLLKQQKGKGYSPLPDINAKKSKEITERNLEHEALEKQLRIFSIITEQQIQSLSSSLQFVDGLCNYFQHKRFNQWQMSVYNKVLYSLTATKAFYL